MRNLTREAIDLSNSTEQVLTYLRVTAVRAKLDDMGKWLEQETTGYRDEEPVPEYRRWHGRVIGSIQAGGMYIASLQDLTELLPEELMERATLHECRMGIGAIEKALREHEHGGMMKAQIQGEIVAALNAGQGRMGLSPGHVCISAEQRFGANHVEEIPKRVRQKAIHFCLECEKAGIILPHPMEDDASPNGGEPFWNDRRRKLVMGAWRIVHEAVETADRIKGFLPAGGG